MLYILVDTHIYHPFLIIRPFTLYLVCLFFAAHGRNVQERNYECRHISHSLFSKIWNPYSRPAHMTIWLGDLNYRLEGINTHPARNLIDQDLHQVINSSAKWNIHIVRISLQLNPKLTYIIHFSCSYFRSCMVMINSCNKLEKDKFSMDFVREH
jgi:hypothetical protein